jgi:hypothetical protein
MAEKLKPRKDHIKETSYVKNNPKAKQIDDQGKELVQKTEM